MSGFNYNGSATTALSLIKKFGQKLPLVRYSVASYDPVTGESLTPAFERGTVDCVVLPIGKQSVEGLDDKYVEALIQGRVRKIIIAAKTATFPPLAGDLVTYEGFNWNLLSIIPLNPAGVPVIYTAGIERGGLATSSDSPTDWDSITDTWDEVTQTWEEFV